MSASAPGRNRRRLTGATRHQPAGAGANGCRFQCIARKLLTAHAVDPFSDAIQRTLVLAEVRAGQ